MLQKLCSGIGLAALLLVGSMPTLAAGKIGQVIAVVGSPSASGPGGDRTLTKNSDVFEDDTIKVTDGNAQIMLDDGTRLVVGPSSSLLLDQFVMRGKSQAEKVAIKGLRGTYRFITGRSAKSAYKISTAHGTIGIRGTAFDFWSRNKTGAVVLRGKVNLKSQSGSSVDVNSGCQMGEATLGTSQILKGQVKTNAIKQNLPFLLDQSSLNRRFRLDLTTCRLGAPGTEGGSDAPEPQEEQGRQRLR
jgi:hypothetical protein